MLDIQFFIVIKPKKRFRCSPKKYVPKLIWIPRRKAIAKILICLNIQKFSEIKIKKTEYR